VASRAVVGGRILHPVCRASYRSSVVAVAPDIVVAQCARLPRSGHWFSGIPAALCDILPPESETASHSMVHGEALWNREGLF
jgi:hypothetical protein